MSFEIHYLFFIKIFQYIVVEYFEYFEFLFLYGTKKENGVDKVYVFDPNVCNKYINELFPLRKIQGDIEAAKRRQGADFGIVARA